MKKILLLADVNSTHIRKLVNGLIRKEFDIYLFSLSTPFDDWHLKTGVRLISRSNVHDEINFSANDISKLSYLKKLKQLKKQISIIRPDIIHAYYATSYGLLAALSGHPNFFLSVWGSDILDFPKRSFFHKMMMRYILKKAKRIFATSIILKNVVFELSRRPAELIPYGVDTDFFKPVSVQKQDEFSIGAVKALEEIYGIDILINAFSIVCKNNPSLKLKLVLVGKGSKEAEYRKLVKELNLENCVLFSGRVLQEHLPPYFSRFDIFANLSRSESFGVSVLEAMSCECPVVVSSVGGLPEIVSKDCGILVEHCTAENCAMSFQIILDDYSTAKKMGVAARERVIKLFNWQDTLEKTVAAYNLN